VPVLRWCTLGILGRVFSWPMGFVILAKGKGQLFLLTEIFASSLHLGAVFIFIQIWGLNGAGVAFMVLYVIYTALMLFVVRRLVGSTWDRHTLKQSVFASTTMLVLMINCTLDSNLMTVWTINLIVFSGILWFCLKQLSRQSNINFQELLVKLRLK